MRISRMHATFEHGRAPFHRCTAPRQLSGCCRPPGPVVTLRDHFAGRCAVSMHRADGFNRAAETMWAAARWLLIKRRPSDAEPATDLGRRAWQQDAGERFLTLHNT